MTAGRAVPPPARRLRGLLATALKAMPAAAAARVRERLERTGAPLEAALAALAVFDADLPDGRVVAAEQRTALLRGTVLLACAEAELAEIPVRPVPEATAEDVRAILAGDVALAFGYRALCRLPDDLHARILEAFAESARARLAQCAAGPGRTGAPESEATAATQAAAGVARRLVEAARAADGHGATGSGR